MTKKVFTSLVFVCLISGFNLIAQEVYDAGMVTLQMDSYSKYGEVSVKGVFKNNGNVNLSSIDIYFQEEGGKAKKYHKDNFDIRPGQSWLFLHPDKLTLNKTQNYFIKVWLESPNGQADSNTSNDTLVQRIQVIQNFPEKHFLIEEITGAWCGYCPRAPIIFEKVVKPAYPNAIMVAVHTGDAMTCTDGSAAMNAYVSGVPCGFVNRSNPSPYPVDMSPEQWKGALDKLDPEFTPADINVYNYFDPETKEWKIDVVADFVLDFSGDLRLNCYVIEDGLSGTGSQWAQRNFFNASASEPYMELQGAGDPLPNYVHNHVVRKMLGGSWGAPDIIPNQVYAGERYVYSQTFVVPDNWNMDQVHLIGLLQCYHSDKNKRPILNAKEAELSLKTGVTTLNTESGVKVYPNPGKDWINFEFSEAQNYTSLEILDLQGRLIRSIPINSNSPQLIQLDISNLDPGLYFYKAYQANKPANTGRFLHY